MFKKNLVESEYLAAFDTFCEKVWTLLGLEISVGDNALLTFSQIVELRQKAMIDAYKKFGPVYYNYLDAQLLLPLQNSWIRFSEYIETKNVQYLIDTLNFIMLAYWHRENKVADVPSQEELTYIRVTKIQLDERNSELQERYLAYLETYSDTDELCYLAVLAYIVYMEVLNPTIQGAFYNEKDGRVCALAGIYINQFIR